MPKPRQKKVFGIRDAAAKAREPEADPDQAALIKKITVNFDELYVAAVANRIYVYESECLKPIDVSKHDAEITDPAAIINQSLWLVDIVGPWGGC